MSIVALGSDDDASQVVKSIVDRKRPQETGGSEELLVEWKGCPHPENYTWELQKHIVDAKVVQSMLSTGTTSADVATRAYVNFLLTRRACHMLVANDEANACSLLKHASIGDKLRFCGNERNEMTEVHYQNVSCKMRRLDGDQLDIIDHCQPSRLYLVMLGHLSLEFEPSVIRHPVVGTRSRLTCIANALHAIYALYHRRTDTNAAITSLLEHVRRIRDVGMRVKRIRHHDAATEIDHN